MEKILQYVGLAAVVAGQAMFLFKDRSREASHVLKGPLGVHDLALHGARGNDGQGRLPSAPQSSQDYGGIGIEDSGGGEVR